MLRSISRSNLKSSLKSYIRSTFHSTFEVVSLHWHSWEQFEYCAHLQAVSAIHSRSKCSHSGLGIIILLNGKKMFFVSLIMDIIRLHYVTVNVIYIIYCIAMGLTMNLLGLNPVFSTTVAALQGRYEKI